MKKVTVTCTRKRYRLVFSQLPDRVFGPYDLAGVRAQLETGALLSPIEARTLALEAFEFGKSEREVQG